MTERLLQQLAALRLQSGPPVQQTFATPVKVEPGLYSGAPQYVTGLQVKVEPGLYSGAPQYVTGLQVNSEPTYDDAFTPPPPVSVQSSLPKKFVPYVDQIRQSAPIVSNAFTPSYAGVPPSGISYSPLLLDNTKLSPTTKEGLTALMKKINDAKTIEWELAVSTLSAFENLLPAAPIWNDAHPEIFFEELKAARNDVRAICMIQPEFFKRVFPASNEAFGSLKEWKWKFDAKVQIANYDPTYNQYIASATNRRKLFLYLEWALDFPTLQNKIAPETRAAVLQIPTYKPLVEWFDSLEQYRELFDEYQRGITLAHRQRTAHRQPQNTTEFKQMLHVSFQTWKYTLDICPVKGIQFLVASRLTGIDLFAIRNTFLEWIDTSIELLLTGIAALSDIGTDLFVIEQICTIAGRPLPKRLLDFRSGLAKQMADQNEPTDFLKKSAMDKLRAYCDIDSKLTSTGADNKFALCQQEFLVRWGDVYAARAWSVYVAGVLSCSDAYEWHTRRTLWKGAQISKSSSTDGINRVANIVIRKRTNASTESSRLNWFKLDDASLERVFVCPKADFNQVSISALTNLMSQTTLADPVQTSDSFDLSAILNSSDASFLPSSKASAATVWTQDSDSLFVPGSQARATSYPAYLPHISLPLASQAAPGTLQLAGQAQAAASPIAPINQLPVGAFGSVSTPVNPQVAALLDESNLQALITDVQSLTLPVVIRKLYNAPSASRALFIADAPNTDMPEDRDMYMYIYQIIKAIVWCNTTNVFCLATTGNDFVYNPQTRHARVIFNDTNMLTATSKTGTDNRIFIASNMINALGHANPSSSTGFLRKKNRDYSKHALEQTALRLIEKFEPTTFQANGFDVNAPNNLWKPFAENGARYLFLKTNAVGTILREFLQGSKLETFPAITENVLNTLDSKFPTI